MADDKQSFLAKLGGLLGLNTGMAGQAATTMQMRPYQLYVQEQQAMGLQPLSPEEWQKMMMQQSQQQMPQGGLLGR
jgi:hypothetical protein